VPKIYKIAFSRKALKFFNGQTKDQQKRVAMAISELPQGDTKRFKGYKGLYRLRVGEYRIIYTVQNEELIIAVLSIGNRGDVYKDL
jgi:mRNA interferase RelE/StbE